MNQLENLLMGGDLRSIGIANAEVVQVKDRKTFDELVDAVSNSNR